MFGRKKKNHTTPAVDEFVIDKGHVRFVMGVGTLQVTVESTKRIADDTYKVTGASMMYSDGERVHIYDHTSRQIAFISGKLVSWFWLDWKPLDDTEGLNNV